MARESRPLVFLGTPSAAADILRAIHAAGFPVAHVISRPDARRGRGAATSPSPVKQVALELGIGVSHDLSWFDDHRDLVALGIVVAYGRIIPADVLGRCPMINVHFSLLPRWRGAAPVERAILAGDDTTGVCIMDLEETLDTGPVRACAEVAIHQDHTTATLTADLAAEGARLLVGELSRGLSAPVAQSGTPTYAHKIEPAENRIDWGAANIDVHRRIRALRAHTLVDGTRLKVLSATIVDTVVEGPPGTCGADAVVATGDGALRLEIVQPEGKRAMAAIDWMRGRSPGGARFE